MIRYGGTVYHDGEFDAAEVREDVGLYLTERAAIDAVRRKLDGYWHYGSVHRGTLTPGKPGVRPERFESDDDYTPPNVGPDWID